MLSRNEPYRELGANYFDERRRHYTVDRLARRIEHLGYQVHFWNYCRWPRRKKFSRQSGVVLLEEAREPHRCHQSIYLSLPPDKSGSVT